MLNRGVKYDQAGKRKRCLTGRIDRIADKIADMRQAGTLEKAVVQEYWIELLLGRLEHTGMDANALKSIRTIFEYSRKLSPGDLQEAANIVEADKAGLPLKITQGGHGTTIKIVPM